ncbi:MAG TPA: biosynthetic peptidoglycan transglycosylase, partial [Micromonosporaceae bacterium]|nr:biosynthetic peptidoglycan transglycosylase [Micromonosporaceae bacterium]
MQSPEHPQPTSGLRRPRLVAAAAVLFVLVSLGLAVATTYVDSVPTPEELELPQATTVYYADGKTPMAKLGTENRTILPFAEMNDAVKQGIVAAEDRTFWTNEGVDFGSVLRAAWNNLTGGTTQGASTITQQYARIAADLNGVTYSRKLREAIMAWKLDDKYHKDEILGFYLNTVPFGRGAYGVEAAAREYFGKTANRHAAPDRQVTVAEAMLLASMVKQPEPDPDDPDARPGYDPTRGPAAAANARARWDYVRAGMVELGYLDPGAAAGLRFPDSVRPYDQRSRQSGLDRPTGLVVQHALSELRQTEA